VFFNFNIFILSIQQQNQMFFNHVSNQMSFSVVIIHQYLPNLNLKIDLVGLHSIDYLKLFYLTWIMISYVLLISFCLKLMMFSAVDLNFGLLSFTVSSSLLMEIFTFYPNYYCYLSYLSFFKGCNHFFYFFRNYHDGGKRVTIFLMDCFVQLADLDHRTIY
jgi:hypothetical protein